ncbi:hypothetical protein [uncultured Xylophilus sp.]|uniref:hypothetical protein n=1 Tax=uncultured Xylophilus sp. TaxID=296832 RepID=UPI0025CCE678|nr:hypothetical protein [uncultured Xylophilus sp.]
MSATGFQRLAAGIVAMLGGAVPVAAHVDRARGRPIPQGVPSAVVVRLRGSTAESGRMAFAPVEWATQVLVECYAAAPGSAAGEALVDPLLLAVHDRLAADPQLGGLARDSEIQQIAWDIDSADLPAGCAGLLLLVRHRTPAASIF